MGAVNTTYTFTATDTITSTKMNNIIDETVMTSQACLTGGGLEVASGQLTISANAINSSRLAANSVSSSNIVDGTIVNADISPTAAIAGTKIAASFGSQDLTATGDLWLAGTVSDYTKATLQNTSGVQTQFFANANTDSGLLTTSNHPLTFGTNNTERMRITAAGNVGVGTNSPQNIFEVNAYSTARSSANTGTARIEAQSNDYWTGTTYTGTSILQSGSAATGTTCGLPNANLGSLTFQNGSAGLINTNGSTPIVFATTSSERMRIDSSGNIGIGKTNPSTILDVNGTITATAFAGPLTGNATTASACTGNSATATNLSTTKDNWNTNGTISATVGQLAWKNYGNSHTIFDASAGTTPSGTSCNRTNADVGWSSNLPTLMGWNGTNTHGVRVDSAKFADTSSACTGNSATATTASTVSNGAITAAKLDGAQSGSAPIFGVRAWANIDGTVGSVSVRQGGNVSGVVRNQLGRYTITFATPMQDTNYAIVAWARDANATDNNYFVSAASNATKLAGSFQIEVNSPGGTVDSPEIGVMVIR